MGAGKTKLISKAIDHFQNHAYTGLLAYFYCNRNDDARRDPENVLRSFAKQLSMSPGQDAIHDALFRSYNLKRQTGFGSNKLSFEESEELLQELIRSFASYQRTTLILDAMDECDERVRLELIDVFNRLVETCDDLKILISSRENTDIQRQLQKEVNIGIQATDNHDDIYKFVMSTIALSRVERPKPLPKDLQEEITTTILDKSKGMCVTDHLSLCI